MLVIDVDRSLCQGHARCFGTCPEVFALGADGLAEIRPDADLAAHEAGIRQAAGNCPEYAIILTEI